MVRIAAIEVVLNSSWVTEKKPTVSKQVVHGGDDGADGELPFEAEPQVHQHGEDRHHDAERTGLDQFARHARPNHLDAAELVVLVVERGSSTLLDRGLLRHIPARLDAEA